MSYRLVWKGAETRAQVVRAIVAGLTEFGLRVEAEAKRELTPGHGVLTGTLRRSVHAAAPEYDFARDDTVPASNTPERGGTGGEAQESEGKVVISVGSGMKYARVIEERYGYLRSGLNRVSPQILEILQKHGERAGLK